MLVCPASDSPTGLQPTLRITCALRLLSALYSALEKIELFILLVFACTPSVRYSHAPLTSWFHLMSPPVHTSLRTCQFRPLGCGLPTPLMSSLNGALELLKEHERLRRPRSLQAQTAGLDHRRAYPQYGKPGDKDPDPGGTHPLPGGPRALARGNSVWKKLGILNTVFTRPRVQRTTISKDKDCTDRYTHLYQSVQVFSKKSENSGMSGVSGMFL